MDGGKVSLQDVDVELGICAWRRGRIRCVDGGGIGFIVGDGGYEIGWMASVTRSARCLPAHDGKGAVALLKADRICMRRKESSVGGGVRPLRKWR